MSIVLGIVGEKGSGKETFAKLLAKCRPELSISHVRSSDVLAATLVQWDIPLTRHNLQHMAVVMDEGFGLGTLTHAVKKSIEAAKTDIVVFDGVRWNTDAVMIRSFPKNALVYVTASLETRYARTKARKEKIGESTATLEQFKKEESVKTELDIPRIGKSADVKIDNEGALEDFEAQVKEFCEKFLN